MAAACRNMKTDIFFPERGVIPRAAMAVCARCTVRPQCLQYALDNDEVGIWGGKTYEARRRMRMAKR